MVKTDELTRADDPDFMASLARGLAVMRTVAESSHPATIADISRTLGISRAAVARCVHTLSTLGYMGREVRGYVVRRKATGLGHPFLSLTALAARAQPMLDSLRDRLGESCSLGMMEDDDLCYVARAQAVRIMSVGLNVGSRLPLYPTSMGRVLLAGRTPEEQEAYLARTPLNPLTPRTVVDAQQLLVLIRSSAVDGYTIVDGELELGVRSVAVPVREGGRVVAALNIGTSVARISKQEIRHRLLPALLEAAARLST